MLENNNIVQNHPFHEILKNYLIMPNQNQSLSIDQYLIQSNFGLKSQDCYLEKMTRILINKHRYVIENSFQ